MPSLSKNRFSEVLKETERSEIQSLHDSVAKRKQTSSIESSLSKHTSNSMPFFLNNIYCTEIKFINI